MVTLPEKLVFRAITQQDATLIYQWRNHPDIRQYASNQQPFSFSDHKKWLEKTLENPQQHLLMIQQVEQAAGVIQLNEENNSAIISMYVNPDYLNQGLGTRAFKQIETWLQENLPHIKSLQATVLTNNQRSIRALQNAGYVSKTVQLERIISNEKTE